MKCNIIKMISCYDCSQMLRISLKTENSLSPTPGACTSFLTLSVFIVAGQPLQYGEVRDSYWCEWVLWSQQPCAHVSFGYTVWNYIMPQSHCEINLQTYDVFITTNSLTNTVHVNDYTQSLHFVVDFYCQSHAHFIWFSTAHNKTFYTKRYLSIY